MTKWQVQRIEEPPEGATVHYVEVGSSVALQFSHSGYCGTFGYILIHTDDESEVTRERCLALLRGIDKKRSKHE